MATGGRGTAAGVRGGRGVQPSSRHPLLWWGVKPTLFGKHQLEQHPGPHGAL